jgi:hypothetical protein
VFSQSVTVKQIEIDLHLAYSNILSCRTETLADWDSLAVLNEIFRDKLLRYTSACPSTLTYNFDSLLQNDIMIVSSENKLFRIYSWGNFLGGTMQYFENVFQYKVDDKVFSTTGCDTTTDEETGYVPFYSRVFTLNSDGKTYYLAVGNGIYSSNDASQSIQVFTIENQTLVDTVGLIMTKRGLVNAIDVSFNFFSVAGRPERPLRLIKYDNTKKIIYIPIVYDDGTVTDRFILYKFDGHVFKHFRTERKRR